MAGLIRVVCAAIIADERLLLVRKRGTTPFMLPGGKPEPGEAPLDALRREIREELGCDLIPGPELPGTFRDVAANEPDHIVQARIWAARLEGAPIPAAEIAELRWAGAADITGLPLAPLMHGSVLAALVRAGLLPQAAVA
ncbi:Putative Nudix hydrolase yvcI [Gluconacetobacter sp. SXCC-1]|uniref:NUDIX domain-containing protein n=1 Tax=Komagataeibacter rhaeticus TaxID=215221 RepID=A0A181CCC9_9PROT|nr:NUDIX domain-containing protein [Komagataeibacter rhaeticus]ATU71957.1 NUDIX domain-containing protein [Komagataeibacter xylinus]EGG75546.1 Putative Nudix hydrolase yvcI [Gluconacetobacter sp. SXCC-1]QIP35920.1 NUDIX domain-containing protein [Komagataeibacter rhaeticus]QOC45681.1 NUDIX domain-containing protein [Komagataeibacter rhaeticus]WPP21652.1 NUDIX domain-containing protein [Komagataeibacter rhaeticus]